MNSIFFNLITYPGLVIHRFAHRFFCDVLNVPIYQSSYLNSENIDPFDCLAHAFPNTITQAFLITYAPFIINMLLIALLSIPFYIHIWYLGNYSLKNLILSYINFALIIHAIPNDKDMETLSKNLVHLRAKEWILVMPELMAFIHYMILVGLVYLWLYFLVWTEYTALIKK